MLVGWPKTDNMPRSRVLRMLSSDIDGDEACCGAGDLFPIVNEESVQKSERYTSVYDMDDNLLEAEEVSPSTSFSSAGSDITHVDRRSTGKLSQIDHILATRGIKDRVRRVWIDHSHNPDIVSDHWPIFFEFDMDIEQSSPSESQANLLSASILTLTGSTTSTNGSKTTVTGAAVALIAVVVAIPTALASFVVFRWKRKQWATYKREGVLVDGATTFNPIVYQMQARDCGGVDECRMGNELVSLADLNEPRQADEFVR